MSTEIVQDSTTSSVASDELNSLYQIRMNEFCSNHISQATNDENVRPKPSISPINVSQIDSFLAPPEINNSHSSPFVGPRLLHLDQNPLSGSSPFVPLINKQHQPLNKHLLAVQMHSIPKMGQFQSTPSKSDAGSSFLSPVDFNGAGVKKVMPNRVNFHSIHDLAKSSSSSSIADESTNNSSLASNSNSSVLQETASSGYASSLSFNESLKHLSESIMANKENYSNSQLELSKV